MFQPVIPATGLVGWRFLQRTYDRQLAVFTETSTIEREKNYFRSQIGQVTSASDLVADRRLLSVALGAFGLENDINNRFFIQKILEEGTSASDALANRFSDKRYKELSATFGFGPGEDTKVSDAGFSDAIVDLYEKNRFEIAVGEQNPALRISMYSERKVTELSASELSNDAKWFTILGDPPLRSFFQLALGLPSSVGQIDIDQQLKIFKERAEAEFGSDDFSQFTGKQVSEKLTTKYLLRDQIASMAGSYSSGSVALTLLRQL